MGHDHLKGWQQHVYPLSLFIDAVKTSVRHGIAACHMVAVVGELFTGNEAWCFTDDLVALDNELAPIGVDNHPFAS